MPSSGARMDPFMRGKAVGMAEAGLSATVIAPKVFKTDGTHPSARAVRKMISDNAANSKWRGAHRPGPGRPSPLNNTQRHRLRKLVFKYRAKKFVTTKFCKKRLRFLRRLTRWSISRELHAAGLAWLRRRRKHWVPKDKRQSRINYARWILRRRAKTLKSYAYIDGTTFYLARDEAQESDQKRRRLGAFVWRMASGRDGLFTDNVGPSFYAAHQGQPVKVWGFFGNGRLIYHVLPADGTSTVHMNGLIFRRMIARFAKKWKRVCFGRRVPRRIPLVQDHERCLWQDKSLKTLRAEGLEVETNFPKSSPDLNAIEGVWNLLRQLLDKSAPDVRETRARFLVRLRRQVHTLNRKHRKELKEMSTNQKVRAVAVLKLKGAKTCW